MGSITVLAGQNKSLPPTEQDILRSVSHVSGPGVFVGELGSGEATLGLGATLTNLTGAMSVRNPGPGAAIVSFQDSFFYSQVGAALSLDPADAGKALDAFGGPALAVGYQGATITSAGALGASQTFNVLGSKQAWIRGTLTANLAVSVSGLSAGALVVLLVTQDATGGRTMTLNGVAMPVAAVALAPSVVRMHVVSVDDVVIEVSAGVAPPAPPFDILTLNPRFWIDVTQFNALANGTAIASATDSSANLRHAVQATAANQPTKQVSGTRTLMRFDGVNDVLVGPITNLATADSTLMVTTYLFSKTNSSGTFVSLADTVVELRQATTTGVAEGVFSGGTLSGGADVSLAPHVLTLRMPLGAPPTLFVDGALVATGAANVAALAATSYGLGARANGVSPLQVDLGDVAWFPTALTPTERVNAEGYFKTKAGIV